MIEPWLLDLLVCPQCKGDLEHRQDPEVLVCHRDRLVFEVRDDIPILLIDEAKPLEEGQETAANA